MPWDRFECCVNNSLGGRKKRNRYLMKVDENDVEKLSGGGGRGNVSK